MPNSYNQHRISIGINAVHMRISISRGNKNLKPKRFPNMSKIYGITFLLLTMLILGNYVFICQSMYSYGNGETYVSDNGNNVSDIA